MSSGRFCLDANLFIAARNITYPADILPSLWEQLATCRNELILIQPIFNEIDPIAQHHRNLSRDEKKEKYPLRMWMQENGFEATPINDEVNAASLMLEQEYQISPISKGAGQRQGEIIRDLAKPQRDAPTGADDIAEAVIRRLRKEGVEA
ncbi:MAG: DUF4411 family protein [Candidatus Electrothrix sp. LOE2]|nr:DUF4411 family protein [Candidatus Electrothrix sp. LOE2]